MGTFKMFSKVVDLAMERLGYTHNLVIYGSSVNGLALRGDSDLDLSLIVHNMPEAKDMIEKEMHVKLILEEVIRVLKTEKQFG